MSVAWHQTQIINRAAWEKTNDPQIVFKVFMDKSRLWLTSFPLGRLLGGKECSWKGEIAMNTICMYFIFNLGWIARVPGEHRRKCNFHVSVAQKWFWGAVLNSCLYGRRWRYEIHAWPWITDGTQWYIGNPSNPLKFEPSTHIRASKKKAKKKKWIEFATGWIKM
jgi:hypothetical protein